MAGNFLWLLWGWHAANFTGNREMEPKEVPCCSIPYVCREPATGNLIVTAPRVHVNNQSTWWMFTVYVPVWINQSVIVTLSLRQPRKNFSVTYPQALMTEIDLNEELVYYFGLFLIKRADDGEATSELIYMYLTFSLSEVICGELMWSYWVILYVLSVVRKFQEFEAPYLTLKQQSETCRVAVRKT